MDNVNGTVPNEASPIVASTSGNPETPDPTTPHTHVAPPPTHFVFWSTLPSLKPVLSHSLLCSILLFLSATKSLPLFHSMVQPLFSTLALVLFRTTLILTATLSFLHRTGALRRYAIRFAEKELRKVMNGTLVTLSDIQVDVWRGKVIAHDLIVHNKDRESWEWESPCLARVGRIEATLNFFSVIEIPHWGPILNHTFKDVYTGLIEDVQVFVEKRKNIFNFHLLDPSLDIPDSEIIMEEYRERRARVIMMRSDNKKQSSKDTMAVDEGSLSSLKESASGEDDDEQRSDLMEDRDGGGITGEAEEQESQMEANRIVERLVGGLSNLGKAANEGGSRGLQSALRNQKESWVKNLKKLHSQTSTEHAFVENDENEKELIKRQASTKLTKDKVAEGMSVMRQLGKVIDQNVSDIKENMTFLQKPPPKKEGWVSKPADIIRIGSLLLREMRIFTKDVLAKAGSVSAPIAPTASTPTMRGKGASPKAIDVDPVVFGWSRPIVVWELAITSAEFSPPMSARDTNTGLPVVGIPIDRAVDIILKRLLTEMAKSNTGRLFQTAFGDVFSFLDVPRMRDTSAKGADSFKG